MNERIEQLSSGGGFTPLWWVAGAFLGLIATAGIVIVVTASSGGPNAGADPVPVTSTVPGTQASRTEDGPPAQNGCDLPEATQDIPVQGPEATWASFGYALVPQSPDRYGPVAVDGRLWGCFAQSPTGALFAAANLFAALGEPNFAEFADQAMVDNPALTTWLSTQDPATRGQEPGQVAQIAGFQFESVQPNQVIVAIGLRQGDVEGAVRIGLVWDEAANTWLGDMALSRFPPYGQELASFTGWRASDG